MRWMGVGATSWPKHCTGLVPGERASFEKLCCQHSNAVMHPGFAYEALSFLPQLVDAGQHMTCWPAGIGGNPGHACHHFLH